ncbi:hypothetical protein T03_15850 [Trichinella britovi]|uniref:Uncharacterized protein n=1 Tax=Trichinella britovi TaxID=45882 RepID=A0A0V1D2Y6_TRIBR|nr:hypothetical protein T03_15850 [Trichinella britovi]
MFCSCLGSNQGPSACEADVITTTLQEHGSGPWIEIAMQYYSNNALANVIDDECTIKMHSFSGRRFGKIVCQNQCRLPIQEWTSRK